MRRTVVEVDEVLIHHLGIVVASLRLVGGIVDGEFHVFVGLGIVVLCRHNLSLVAIAVGSLWELGNEVVNQAYKALGIAQCAGEIESENGLVEFVGKVFLDGCGFESGVVETQSRHLQTGGKGSADGILRGVVVGG